jgi:RHS repeat-associated protein
MTNSAGATVWKASYEPFGKATITTQTIQNNLRLAGQYFDNETGLHYNWHRYYDPKTGRYISSDPIGLAGGLNTYLYAGANPLRFVDPLGLCKIEVRYAQVLEIVGLGYPKKIYHAYLVTTDTDGAQKYFRGGPSRFGIPDWGPISAKFGDYVPGTPDWDPSTPPTDTILNNNSPCGCYNASLEQAAKDLNEAKVLYDPLGPNSNSTANFGLQRMNLGGHRPSVIAPGWGDPLIP